MNKLCCVSKRGVIMVEQDVILKRLVLLDEYLSDLTEASKNVTWEEFNTDKIIRRYIERTLHMAIEACLDIGNHIISYEGYREPKDNKDTFEVMSEEGILKSQQVGNLKRMAQFRNVIVHDYIRVQPEIVYGILMKHLDDISEYVNEIRKKYL